MVVSSPFPQTSPLVLLSLGFEVPWTGVESRNRPDVILKEGRRAWRRWGSLPLPAVPLTWRQVPDPCLLRPPRKEDGGKTINPLRPGFLSLFPTRGTTSAHHGAPPLHRPQLICFPPLSYSSPARKRGSAIFPWCRSFVLAFSFPDSPSPRPPKPHLPHVPIPTAP